MINETKEPEFTGWRAIFFPIHNQELKKFLPLAIIIFCLAFNTSVLRNIKDSLIFDTIGFPTGVDISILLKSYFVTPCAILFIILYARLSSTFSQEKLFYTILIPFLLFFCAFGLILRPNVHLLHPSLESIKALHATYPSLSIFIEFYSYWTVSLFYLLSGIWEIFVVTLIFYQFTNHVVKMNEAKRFYPMFVVVSSFAGIIATLTPMVYSTYIQVGLLMAFVVIIGLFAMYVYRWLHKNVLNDQLYCSLPAASTNQQEKLGFWESLKSIVRSPVLWLIFLLVIAYGTAINLLETQWKNQLKIFCAGDKALFNHYLGLFYLVTGLCTIIFGWTVSLYILRKASWMKAAMITPWVILIGGGVFLGLISSGNIMEPFFQLFGTKTSAVTVMVGFGFIVIAKAFKYTLFDTTKEMSYIPLDNVLKTKGKAFTDFVSFRAGGACGPIIQSSLLIAFATKDVVAIAPISFLILVVIATVWIYAVKTLAAKITQAEAKL